MPDKYIYIILVCVECAYVWISLLFFLLTSSFSLGNENDTDDDELTKKLLENKQHVSDE